MNKGRDNKTREHLISELTELSKKSKEQEDKLKASSQQLDAHTQQLQASEQTLKKQAYKLKEREKKLNCLHNISESVRTRETLEEILQDVIEVIPPSWQYPQITCSKITLWDKQYKTENYEDGQWKLSSDIRVNKKNAGKIEVGYLEKKPESNIGPFLNEERILLDDIAERLGRIIERVCADEELKESHRQLIAANQQLEASNQQLQATEQQLRASNQQLEAANEQLEANNQQLQATEQQLRASNQQLEASNKESIAKEQLLSSIFNTVRDVLFLVDVEAESKFRFNYINKAFSDSTGLSRSDVEGKLIEEVIPEPYIHTIKENYLKSIKEKQLITWEETPKLETGVKVGIASIVPVFDENGYCRQLVGAVNDITEHRQAEEELKASEERFNLAMNASNDGLFDWDLLTNEIYYSPAWKKMIGYADHELPNDFSVWEKITHPEDVKKSWELQQKLIAKQIERFVLEFKMKHKDGHWVDILSRARAIFNDEGKAIRMVGTHTDITESNKTKEAYKEAQSNLQALLDNRKDTIWALDRNYNFLVYNKPYADVIYSNMGVRLEKGMNALEIHPKEVNDFWKPKFDEVFKGKYVTFEFPHVLDGKEHFFEVYMNPIYTDNKVVGLSALSMDITQRKRDEQAQSIIHNISNAVITSHSLENFLMLVKDELGKLIDTTNFFVAFYDEKTDRISLPLQHDEKDRWESYPAGKTLTKYVIKTGKSLLARKDTIEKLIKSGEVEQIGHLSEVWLGMPLKNSHKIHGIFAVQNYDSEHAYDETDVNMLRIISHQISLSLERLKAEEDLKLAKEKAEESNRLKTAFLNNMSHEIRTPLNGITGFIGLLQNPKIDDAAKEKYFDIINKSSSRLIATVTDILDISRIEAGEVKVSKSEVYINEILDEQFKFFYQEAKTKGVELNYKPSLSYREVCFFTDKHKLEGILTNLIKNAIKFTETGSITFGYAIKNQEERDVVEFYVKDTGIGIPENRIDAIFNRFEQADIADTRAFQGSGLGLAISKSYVEMLGGKISVKSKKGEGATFTFSIPYTKQFEKESDTKENNNTQPQTSLSHLSLILAEDDETSKLFYETIFKNKLKKITYTTTGKEAIEKLHENPDTDIILMDIKMPDMNGYDATRDIRKFNTDVVIIAQTAYGLSGDREKALEAGCDDYISKPIKREILFEKIQACLNKKNI